MTTEDSPYYDLLVAAITGSFLGQIGAELGYTEERLLTKDSAEFRQVLSLLDDLGLRSDVTAVHVLRAFVLTLVHEDNAEPLIRLMARCMWNVLGDNESETPPFIYVKAATAVFGALLKSIDPALPTIQIHG